MKYVVSGRLSMEAVQRHCSTGFMLKSLRWSREWLDDRICSDVSLIAKGSILTFRKLIAKYT